MRVLEDFRHIIFRDAPRQALGYRGLAHACLSNQQWVVLAAAAQGLDDALQLYFASDQRVDLASQCLCVQILRVALQRAAGVLLLFGIWLVLWFGWCARMGLVAVSYTHLTLPTI